MIELEKHIRNQREALDSDSPREGHEARFLQKLERQPRRRVNFRHALQVAASIAIILTSTVVLMRNRTGDEVARHEIPATVLEADRYYSTQVSYKYDEIRRFDFDSSEEKMVLLDELKELDDYHQQLLSDLEANPGDERVINALIRHYQLKLDVMDQIILQLNQLKTVKENRNETTI
ncbi:MAG: hypothetical protein ABFS10_10260 [Bacteroidota bacterium]